MRGAGRLIPGDRLRTSFYFGLVAKPRKLVRQYLNGFYRIELIYQALGEAKANYHGRFSILEFGTAQGYAFTKMLYAIRYLDMEDRVVAHAFDSFEGMPEAADPADADVVTGKTWFAGQFGGGYEDLVAYCRDKYPDTHRLHKGYFEDTVTADVLNELEETPPILIWIDCDFYSSTRTVFERLLPHIPSGCIVYFDDYEVFNYGSRFTGEARVVAEVNAGVFGDNVELVLDRALSLDTSRVYRFIRFGDGPRYDPIQGGRDTDTSNRRAGRPNDSALP